LLFLLLSRAEEREELEEDCRRRTKKGVK